VWHQQRQQLLHISYLLSTAADFVSTVGCRHSHIEHTIEKDDVAQHRYQQGNAEDFSHDRSAHCSHAFFSSQAAVAASCANVLQLFPNRL
jgi:hypothetical protein